MTPRKHTSCQIVASESAPNGSLQVYMQSLWEPLRNPTNNRSLCFLSFQTTLTVTLTLIMTLKNTYVTSFSHQKVLPMEAFFEKQSCVVTIEGVYTV